MNKLNKVYLALVAVTVAVIGAADLLLPDWEKLYKLLLGSGFFMFGLISHLAYDKRAKIIAWWDAYTEYERRIFFSRCLLGTLSVSLVTWLLYVTNLPLKLENTVTKLHQVLTVEPEIVIEYRMPSMFDDVLYTGQVRNFTDYYVCFNTQIVYVRYEGNRYFTYAPDYWLGYTNVCDNWHIIQNKMQLPKM